MSKCGKGKRTVRHHAVRKVIRTGLPGLPLLQQCLGTGPGLSHPRLLHMVQTWKKVHPYARSLAQDTPAQSSTKATHLQPLPVQ